MKRASWKFSDIFHGRPFILGKKLSPLFFFKCYIAVSKHRRAKQGRIPGSQSSHAQSRKICGKLGFVYGHTNDQNKGHDDHFPEGAAGALNKKPQIAQDLHLQPPPLALWQNWFAHFWGGSQLEEVSSITQIGTMRVIWAAWLQMQQKAANGRWGSKEECQGTPWLHFVSTTADILPCMPPVWQISGRARA